MSWLDSPSEGRLHAERMAGIMRVVNDHGLAQHDVTLTYHRQTEVRAVADVQSGNEVQFGPRHDRYALQVLNSAKLKRVLTLGPALAQALNVQTVSVEREGEQVWVVVPRAEWEPLRFVDILKGHDLGPGQIILGEGPPESSGKRKRVILDLAQPENAHVGIIGTTGSGKSTLLRTMAASALLGGLGVALLDLSRGLEPLGGHPGVWRGGCYVEPGEIVLALEALGRRLDRKCPPLLVCLDEVPALTQAAPETKRLIQAIAQRGRAAGLHLALGAQHALVEELGATTMRNLPVRIVGQILDPTAAYQATGRGQTAATELRGKGDFLLVRGGETRRFQAPIMDEATLDAWRAKWPLRPVRPWPVVLALPPGYRPGPGRPEDPLSDEIVRRVREWRALHDGSDPAIREVQRWTRELYGVTWRAEKIKRALQEAAT